jgi:hypothetical protein
MSRLLLGAGTALLLLAALIIATGGLAESAVGTRDQPPVASPAVDCNVNDFPTAQALEINESGDGVTNEQSYQTFTPTLPNLTDVAVCMTAENTALILIEILTSTGALVYEDQVEVPAGTNWVELSSALDDPAAGLDENLTPGDEYRIRVGTTTGSDFLAFWRTRCTEVVDGACTAGGGSYAPGGMFFDGVQCFPTEPSCLPQSPGTSTADFGFRTFGAAGGPEVIELSAEQPAACTFNVTADVDDDFGNPVEDGTEVQFSVESPHTVDPADALTVNGTALTKVLVAPPTQDVTVTASVEIGDGVLITDTIDVSCEPTATNTPTNTPTRTRTPRADDDDTDTPTPTRTRTSTPVTAVAGVVVTVTPSPTVDLGGFAGMRRGVLAPSAGTGSGGGGVDQYALGLTLAALGAGLVIAGGCSALLRRRRA